MFAITEVWPWGYENAKGRIEGTLVTLTKALEAESGISVEVTLRPHRRVMRELASGQADFVYLFQNPAADPIGVDLGPIVTTRIFLVGRPERETALTIEGLANQSVAYTRGTYYGEPFRLATDIHKVPVDDLEQGIKMLDLERVDAVLASDQLLFNTMQKAGWALGDFQLSVISHGQTGRLYMSRNAEHPEYENRMREALKTLRREGRLRDIFRVTAYERSSSDAMAFWYGQPIASE
ncbi:ABC-type amino acid transport substrate-binding protein [Tamilnaduibacter salinus]|uniref:ABC-type amino acid transport substrate-binding protein n=1 Tax=Tamilnaduibacter salinus TaxID=1484056 RepID=A0A2U1CVQ0_9GAMM|nr:ABC-type amino acid transport substrate-binding protein [Tamilnaduibacter salinus]